MASAKSFDTLDTLLGGGEGPSPADMRDVTPPAESTSEGKGRHSGGSKPKDNRRESGGPGKKREVYRNRKDGGGKPKDKGPRTWSAAPPKDDKPTPPPNPGYDTPVDLMERDQILVKFAFTDPDALSEDIRFIDRPDDAEMDKRHQTGADEDLATSGRVREGRIDTGEEVMRASAIHCPDIIDDMAKAGFTLVDVHWYKRPKGKKMQFTVVCGFRRQTTDELFMYSENEALRVRIGEYLGWLADLVYGALHVWDNNGLLTFNLNGGTRPTRVLSIIDGAGTVIERPFEPVPEQEPDDNDT